VVVEILGGVKGVPVPIGLPPEATEYQVMLPTQLEALMVTAPGPHLETGLAVGAGGNGNVSTVTVVVVVQEFASLTVMVYEPAATLLKSLDDWKLPLLSRYSNAPVPPEAVTVMVEVEPIQTVGADADATIGGGAGPTTTGAVARHPFASLTVMVYDPAVLPVKV